MPFNKDIGKYGIDFNQPSIKTSPKMNKEWIDLSYLLLHLFPGEIQYLQQNFKDYIVRNFYSKMPGVVGKKVMLITIQEFLFSFWDQADGMNQKHAGWEPLNDGGASEGYHDAPDKVTKYMKQY